MSSEPSDAPSGGADQSPTVDTETTIENPVGSSSPEDASTPTTPAGVIEQTEALSIEPNTPTTDKPSTPFPSTPSTPSSIPLSKIEVIFKPVGDAPILKQSKWNVPLSKTVAWVSGNIRKYLKLETSESLFLYVRQSFAPALDQTIENLYNCFGSGDGKLILHYSRTQAWG